LACHRLGRLLGRGAFLIELLVGNAIESVAGKADVELLGHSKLSSKQLLACLADLRGLPAIPDDAGRIDLGERFLLLDGIMLTARHGTAYLELMSKGKATPPKENQFTSRLFTRSINWDPGLRSANEWIDRYVAALSNPLRSGRVTELEAINTDL